MTDLTPDFNRVVESIEPDDGGSLAKLRCGHSIWFVLPPAMLPPFEDGETYCAACLHDYLDSTRGKGN